VSGPIVIAAGGTGGHFFPAEALAGELVRRGRRVVLFTDARSGGMTSEVFAGCERHVISGAGIAGRGPTKAGRAVLSLALGTHQASNILAGLNSAAVVGFGGYPSVAPVLATRLLRRRPPVLLHEQNAVLGRANRVMARFADILALSFKAVTRVPASARTTITGNPVRPAIAALAGAPYTPPGALVRLLVLGGSLGARVLSDVVPAALAALPAPLRRILRVTQQCRSEDLDRVEAAYRAGGISADLGAFFADVAGRLDTAQLVIARAGASTVAELAVIGRPAILVPLPGAIDDHQTANARALAAVGAAWVMNQNEFTPRTLSDSLQRLLADPAGLSHAASDAARQGQPRAAATLADLVELSIAQDTPS
jgi:UDP-N-acetylglucosamine--N-acetylmuramyl-(pentapeptide) pyrophosphoryl-undecaprenol N-acetylglucosamine transferase